MYQIITDIKKGKPSKHIGAMVTVKPIAVARTHTHTYIHTHTHTRTGPPLGVGMRYAEEAMRMLRAQHADLGLQDEREGIISGRAKRKDGEHKKD